MVGNDLGQNIPIAFVLNGIVKPGTHVGDLPAGFAGVFDIDTMLSVSTTSRSLDKSYRIYYNQNAKGPDNTMGLDFTGIKPPLWYDFGTIYKLHSFEKPSTAKPFIAYLGNDGVSDEKSLKLECGMSYGLNIHVEGESVRNAYQRDISELASFTTPCCEDCSSEVSGRALIKSMIDGINNTAYHVTKFLKIEPVIKCCPVDAPFPKTSFRKWKIDVPTSGTHSTMIEGKLQETYGKNVSLADIQSDGFATFELLTPDVALVDTALIASNTASLINKRNIVDTSTAITLSVPVSTAATDYIIIQDNTGSGAVNNITLTGAYTTGISTAYGSVVLKGDGSAGWVLDDLSVAPSDFTISKYVASECDDCPDCLAGFTKVDGGFKYMLKAMNRTSVDDFSTDALVETFLQSLSITDYVANSGYFMNQDDDLAYFSFVTSTAYSQTISNTVITSIGVIEASCKGSATYSWCKKESSYKIARDVTFVTKIGDCEEGTVLTTTSDKYLEFKSYFEGLYDTVVDSFTIVSQNGCNIKFGFKQFNNAYLEDGCDTYGKDGAKFNFPQPQVGTVKFVSEAWEFNACEEDVTDCKVGLKFTAALVNPDNISDRLFSPHDNIEREPTKVSVTIVRQYENVDTPGCDTVSIPDWTIVQLGKEAEGLGQTVVKEEILSRNYASSIYINPRGEDGALMAEKLGFSYLAKASKKYATVSVYSSFGKLTRFIETKQVRKTRFNFHIEEGNVDLLSEVKSYFNGLGKDTVDGLI